MMQTDRFPAGSCDTHVHVFGPQSRYPYAAQRRYTPEDALLPEYLAMAKTYGIDRTVLSQPSTYGTDNTALLDALIEARPAFRGIAMVDESIDDAELERFHKAGVRALRTQFKKDGIGKPLDCEGIRRMAHRIAPLGWHVEIHLDVGQIQDVDARFADYPVDVVIEHMGHMPASMGVHAPGFQSLLRLVGAEGGWVKLSGAYINASLPYPYADVRPFVEALVNAAPSRAVWGSNWPHPHTDPAPDNGQLCGLVREWFPTAEMRQRILVDNPARLYDF